MFPSPSVTACAAPPSPSRGRGRLASSLLHPFRRARTAHGTPSGGGGARRAGVGIQTALRLFLPSPFPRGRGGRGGWKCVTSRRTIMSCRPAIRRHERPARCSVVETSQPYLRFLHAPLARLGRNDRYPAVRSHAPHPPFPPPPEGAASPSTICKSPPLAQGRAFAFNKISYLPHISSMRGGIP